MMTKMKFILVFSNDTVEVLKKLEQNKSLAKRFKAVQKALAYLSINPRHPSLNTHKYKEFSRANGEEIFEAYAENHTSGVYRIFWHYGPDKDTITILDITPHP